MGVLSIKVPIRKEMSGNLFNDPSIFYISSRSKSSILLDLDFDAVSSCVTCWKLFGK